MAEIFVSQHPLVRAQLAELRDKRTDTPRFRSLLRELSLMLVNEATADLNVRTINVETPLETCTGVAIAERIGLVPVLRAGLAMAEAMLTLVPDASVWHLGLYRDHETLKPVEYYNKLPPTPSVDVALVLDPMLATGGSAIHAISILKKWGARRIKFIGLIAAPEGVAAIQAEHPDVDLHLGAIDRGLNEVGYIVPGLGDAGDRQFGTHE